MINKWTEISEEKKEVRADFLAKAITTEFQRRMTEAVDNFLTPALEEFKKTSKTFNLDNLDRESRELISDIMNDCHFGK